MKVSGAAHGNYILGVDSVHPKFSILNSQFSIFYFLLDKVKVLCYVVSVLIVLIHLCSIEKERSAYMISINYRDPRPLYEQIKESIIKLIMTKSLSENEQLPSVRELAVDLAINANTIQRAYRELENEGYIYKISGKGTFVSPQEQYKPNTDELMKSFKDAASKLLFAGESCDALKKEIEKLEKEVMQND